MYKVGSLFAGIGGICKAFEKAGFELSWANEFDKFACITYKNNFSHNLIEDDIHNIEGCSLEKIDVLTSGFPCQAFSIAGERKGFSDSRGDLFFETMRIAKELRPKVIFFENVKNLKSHDNGNTFRVIEKTIKENSYTFSHFILNTAFYGNIPQNRERIYIISFDKNNKNLNHITKYSDFKLTTLLKPKMIDLSKTIHDFINKDKQEDIFYYEKSKYFKMLNDNIINRNTIYQLRRVYVRENKNNLCPTLTANMGTGGHNVPIIKDDFGIRKLTPLECLKFQGFDDNFKIPSIANSHIYKQAGNSVSIPVVERIAINIKLLLDNKFKG